MELGGEKTWDKTDAFYFSDVSTLRKMAVKTSEK